MRFQIPLPQEFHWAKTIGAHGWWMLPPFEYDLDQPDLLTTYLVLRNETHKLEIKHQKSALKVMLSKPSRLSGTTAKAPKLKISPDQALKSQVREIVQRMLAFEFDRTSFRREWRRFCSSTRSITPNTGAFLRSPTLFEDVIKTVLTTNCSWAFTKQMAQRLVEGWGRGPEGAKAFPRPRDLARTTEQTLRKQARTGYRSPSIVAIAKEFAKPNCALEKLILNPEVSEELLEGTLRALPGVGPYAAQSLLRIYGRPAGLGLDSYLRSRFYEKYHQGRSVKDSTIERRYKSSKGWAGLIIWEDLTRGDED